MTLRKWAPSFLAVLALGLATTLVTVDHADARRGGSFGSRGSRTWSAPRATPTAPTPTRPVDRSMTPRSQQNGLGQSMASRRGFFGGGFAGSMMRGLLIGGLFGLLLGHGLGGLAGFFGLILQIGIIALVVMLAMRFFRSRQPAAASGSMYGGPMPGRYSFAGPGSSMGSVPGAGGRPGPAGYPFQARQETLAIGQPDLETFERLLNEIQLAFGREDYNALQQHTTPEVMSYLAEELARNAAQGLRNEVSDVKLLQGDLSEAWREGGVDYATVAMRYESRDVMRVRSTNQVASGDPTRLTQTTEIWTFVRSHGGGWKLSAIQET